MNNVKSIDPAKEDRDIMLKMIEELRLEILKGDVTRIGLMTLRSNCTYSTEYSSSANRVEDAGMLLELAIRRLGYGR